MVNIYYFIIKLLKLLLIIIFYFILFLISGIKDKSILFELSSIKFPRSFLIDIMHLFFENIASQMFKLWSAHFFKDDNLNIIPFNILSKSFWDLIGFINAK